MDAFSYAVTFLQRRMWPVWACVGPNFEIMRPAKLVYLNDELSTISQRKWIGHVEYGWEANNTSTFRHVVSAPNPEWILAVLGADKQCVQLNGLPHWDT